MISVSSLKASDGPSGLPLTTCVRCHVRTIASETEALELPVHKFRIPVVCHVACKHLTSVTNSLKCYWKQICLTRPRRLVTFIYRCLRNILTYLLTYYMFIRLRITNWRRSCWMRTWLLSILGFLTLKSSSVIYRMTWWAASYLGFCAFRNCIFMLVNSFQLNVSCVIKICWLLTSVSIHEFCLCDSDVIFMLDIRHFELDVASVCPCRGYQSMIRPTVAHLVSVFLYQSVNELEKQCTQVIQVYLVLQLATLLDQIWVFVF